VIFCEICRQMRFSAAVYADVTSLNFNLLFEIGYALALGLPTIPMRDGSYVKDKRLFSALGVCRNTPARRARPTTC
jgi:nucleoside 2-deoxyribosyltransferase